MKKAYILHAASGTGKSTIAEEIEQHSKKNGYSTVRINMDDYWDRVEQGDYTFLINQSDVLIIELGWCEKRFGEWEPGDSLGATRNPKGWKNILEQENRNVQIFRLIAPWMIVRKRAENRHRYKTGSYLPDLMFHRQHNGDIHQDYYQLSLNTGFVERVINTTDFQFAMTEIKKYL